MQAVAQGWLVLRLTHNSGSALGFVTALQFLPVLLFGAWSGVLADRCAAVLSDFFAAKRRYDPDALFTNTLYAKYATSV